MSRTRGRAAERERIEQAERKAAEKHTAARRKNLTLAGGVLLAVAAFATYIYLQPEPPGEVFASLGNDHLASEFDTHVPYNSSPPSSGPHVGFLAAWGEQEAPVRPEIFLHNLEDGGVVLTYDCPDGCDDIVTGLRDAVVKDFPGDNLLLTEYPGIVDATGTPHLGAAVAWTRVLYFDDWSEDTQDEVYGFIRLFEGLDHHVRAAGTPR